MPREREAQEGGSRLPAACIDNSSRASPRVRKPPFGVLDNSQGAGKPAHADSRMCALDGSCRDPGSRRTGGENGRREPPPRATVGQCCPARGDRRVARPFRRRALTRDVAVPESLCAHIKSPRKRLTSLRGVV